MAVRITEALKAQLESLKAALEAVKSCSGEALGPEKLLADFERWKTIQGEYGSYFFGKDGGYIAPKVDGNPYVLRHVHLPPMTDREQLDKWNLDWKRKSRKTSNRVLVYCQDGSDYLLIYVLPEPDAHEIARMENAADRATMIGFARVAEAFVNRREVIV